MCFKLAHQDAFRKGKTLHRDISLGNVLIGMEGNALLIDWELSKNLAIETPSNRKWRTVGILSALFS